MYSLQPIVTVKWILSRITQEQIFEYYLKVPVQTKKLFRSSIREDSYPTCSFKYYNDKLILKDFNGHFSGDCFKLVGFLYNISYSEILQKIASDFELTTSKVKYTYKPTSKPVKAVKAKIEIKKRGWNTLDAKYWKQFNINSKILSHYSVSAISNCWIDDKLVYWYKKEDPAYSYYFGNGEFKIYFPKRREFRFLSNTQAIQGYTQLPKERTSLIITKSLKDVMSLYSFGMSAIALQNEIVIPNKELIDDLKGRFDRIYLLYDFDLTGIRTSNKIRRLYNISQLFFTNGRFNSTDFKAKDFTDYVKLVGKDSVDSMINHLIIEL